MSRAAWLAAAGAVAAGCLGAVARADSFAPVRMSISVAPTARLHRPLPVTVHASADPQSLNDGGGTVRAQVKLTRGECGGTFRDTGGVVLMDKPLRPQPGSGVYSGTAASSGRPTSYGIQTVCAFIDNHYQKLADDTADPPQVDVSKACTAAALRYDAARRRHQHGSLSRLHRAARRACGPGVAL